jgi:hypothetical protein
MEGPMTLESMIFVGFTQGRIIAALQTTRTAVKDWCSIFAKAIAEFMQTFRNPEIYKDAENMFNAIEKLLNILVGEFDKITDCNARMSIPSIRKILALVVERGMKQNLHVGVCFKCYEKVKVNLKSVINDTITLGSLEPLEKGFFSIYRKELKLSAFLETVLCRKDSLLENLKLELLSGPSESSLINRSFKLETITALWEVCDEGFSRLLEEGDLITYFSWSNNMLPIQATICHRLLCVEVKATFEDISNLIYSAMPARLRSILADGVKDFVISLTYPGMIRGQISDYKRYLSWMKEDNTPAKDSVLKNLDLEDIGLRLQQDLNAKENSTQLTGYGVENLYGLFALEKTLYTQSNLPNRLCSNVSVLRFFIEADLL